MTQLCGPVPAVEFGSDRFAARQASPILHSNSSASNARRGEKEGRAVDLVFSALRRRADIELPHRLVGGRLVCRLRSGLRGIRALGADETERLPDADHPLPSAVQHGSPGRLGPRRCELHDDLGPRRARWVCRWRAYITRKSPASDCRDSSWRRCHVWPTRMTRRLEIAVRAVPTHAAWWRNWPTTAGSINW